MLQPFTTAKRLFIQNFLYLVDKEECIRTVPFNRAQLFLIPYLVKNLLIALKSRQMGVSTVIIEHFFFDAITIPGTVGVIISHEDFATRRLLDKVKLMYSRLPDDIRPKTRHSSDNELSMANESIIYIGTAGQRAFGRGDTIHRCLCSEVAYWPDPERLMPGIIEATAKGQLILESTTNGDSGYYYDLIQEALDDPDGPFTLVPLYWWMGDDNWLPRGAQEASPGDRGELVYTVEEAELVSAHNLNEGQIRWRRWKKRVLRDKFSQEHIEDVVSCFLGAKDMVFDDVSAQIEALARGCREPHRVGPKEVWKPPQVGIRYSIGVDPSSGESVSSKDPHAVIVCAAKPSGCEHGATMRAALDIRAMADKVGELGKEYNTGLITVERNGVGLVMLKLLQELGYPNLQRERLNLVGAVTPLAQQGIRYGWTTSKPSKSYMIAEMISALQSGEFITWDINLIREMRAFVFRNGKAQAKPGAHDDRVIAAMMALVNARYATSMGRKLVTVDYI